jgi:DNA-binding IclR family transcriptional regulator
MAERKTDYTIDTQQNLMKIVGWLATDVTRHSTVTEISQALDISQNQVFRTLSNLQERSWVERSGEGWRLGPGIAKISEAVRKGLGDTLQRYLGA